MHPQLVSSLAMLKSTYENNDRDYLGAFVSLAAEAIRRSSESVIALPVIQAEIHSIFGIDLPQNVLKSILKRLHQSKHIKIKNHLYYKIAEKLNDTKFSEAQQGFKKKYEEFTESLADFVNKKHNKNWQISDAESALSEYFSENQVLIIDNITSNSRSDLSKHSKPGTKYFVASFLKELQDSESSLFDYFETIFKGNLVANAIFLTDVFDISKRFKNTTVYFDTPFVLSVVGYAGAARKAPCIELVNLVREVGGNLSVFSHTIYETRGVLKGCAREIGRGTANSMMNATTEYFIMTHATESDIIEFSERLEHDLSAIGINVIDKPNYKDQESVIDENSLEHIIRRKIKYSNDGALIRDIDSISAIVRLRQGRISHDIEKCHAIFVSPNNALAHASRRFFAAEYAGWSVPVCITDYELTNLLWVKRPLSAPDLPRKKILADIYAAMQPETSNPQVFADYVKELNKQRDRRQITPEEYANLRYRMESKRAFMDVTLGEKEVLTEGSIAEILVLSDKRMRAEAQKEAVEYAAKAILDARATHQAEQEVISARLAKEETERKTAEEGVGKIQEERLARNTNIKMRASRWSRRTIFVLEVIAAIITLVGTAVTFPWMDLGFGQLSSFFKAGFSVTWFLLVALGFLNLFYGTAVKPYLDGLECWLAKKIEEILHNLSS